MVRSFKYATAAATVLVVALTIVAGALASPSGGRTITLKDKCDPTTFNAVVGPGTCVGSGDVTFSDFVQQLTASQMAGAWRFAPDHTTIDAGTPLTVINAGGETHTFTMVANFGPGFVPFLNALVFPGESQTPIPEFTAPLPAATLASFMPAGSPARTLNLAPGTYMFECGIHPWMRTTVTVEND
jgi:plastocyanin